MVNPRQVGFFDQIYPIQAEIRIKENHELLRLTKLVRWPEMIEIAMNIRASKVKALVGNQY